MNRPTSVLLTNSITLNTGDAAIVEGMMAALRARFGDDTRFEVLDAQPAAAAERYPSHRFARWPLLQFVGGSRSRPLGRRDLPHVARAYVAAWCYGHGLRRVGGALLRPGERRLLDRYAACDLVASTGGTYLVEHYDLTAHLFDYRLCHLMRRRLVLWTQSLGPFDSAHVRRSLRRDLRGALVLLRDERSARHLARAGIRVGEAVLSSDAAFALAHPERLVAAAGARALPRRPRVAISVRELRHPREDREARTARYEEAVAALARRLVDAHGARVTFVSTCQGAPEYSTDDSHVAARIVAQLPEATRAHVAIDCEFRSPQGLIEEMSRYDLVVATRMHMGILALAAGVPVLPIAYEFKTIELFARLGLGDFVLDVEDLDARAAVDVLDDFLIALPRLRGPLFARVEREHRCACAAGARVHDWMSRC